MANLFTSLLRPTVSTKRIAIIESNNAMLPVLKELLLKELVDSTDYEFGFYPDVNSFTDNLINNHVTFDLIIIDLQLAQSLSEIHDFAPRWPHTDLPQGTEGEQYINDDLGLTLAQNIRLGLLGDKIKATPIVILNGRRNDRIDKEIAELEATVNYKPWSKIIFFITLAHNPYTLAQLAKTTVNI